MPGRRIREDHKQYHDLIRDNVRSRLKDHIKSGKKIIRRGKDHVVIDVPVIDLPQFRFGYPYEDGVGSGPADEGDVVGDGPPQPGADSDSPGDEEGEHTIGVGISITDYIDILGETLELPKIKPKDNANIVNQKIKYNRISKVGNNSLLHKKKTLKNVIKRAISSNKYDPDNPQDLYPLPDDKVYKSWSVVDKPDVNAAIFFMSDISASMTEDKRDLIRELCWYLENWIKKFYKETELTYLVHDTIAYEVDQEKFYGYTSGGGTRVSTSFELATDIIDQRYPLDEWNIYCFYLSDGENWEDDNNLCIEYLKKLQDVCNTVGIIETKGDSKWATLLVTILEAVKDGRLDIETIRLGQISSHTDVLVAIKDLLTESDE